jgi:anti-anti-sigma factor
MSITIEQLEHCSIIKIPQKVDAKLVPKIWGDFDDLLKYVNKNVIIDFNETVSIDSSAIGAIAYLYKRLYRQGLTLELIGLHNQPLKKIRELHIDEIMTISRKISGTMPSKLS